MSLDVDKLIEHLVSNVAAGPTGKCARHVRLALAAGGLDTTSSPVSAKDYGEFLSSRAFTPLDAENFAPNKGDIAVIQPYENGSPHGHIAVYDGHKWISDFSQRDMWGGPGYRKHQPSFRIYRYSRSKIPAALVQGAMTLP
jgi:hypothetical protein